MCIIIFLSVIAIMWRLIYTIKVDFFARLLFSSFSPVALKGENLNLAKNRNIQSWARSWQKSGENLSRRICQERQKGETKDRRIFYIRRSLVSPFCFYSIYAIIYPFIVNPSYNISDFLSSDNACDENFC